MLELCLQFLYFALFLFTGILKNVASTYSSSSESEDEDPQEQMPPPQQPPPSAAPQIKSENGHTEVNGEYGS